jgi:hypothetical protein
MKPTKPASISGYAITHCFIYCFFFKSCYLQIIFLPKLLLAEQYEPGKKGDGDTKMPGGPVLQDHGWFAFGTSHTSLGRAEEYSSEQKEQ